jgi:hypothetical protein
MSDQNREMTRFDRCTTLGLRRGERMVLDLADLNLGAAISSTADHTRVANGKRGQAHGPQAESPVRKVQGGPRASPLFPRL